MANNKDLLQMKQIKTYKNHKKQINQKSLYLIRKIIINLKSQNNKFKIFKTKLMLIRINQ